MFELTKEIYEDLVNKCIITDVTMDFEKAKTMKLEDLITRPGVGEYIKNIYGDVSVEIIDENPKDDPNGSGENLNHTLKDDPNGSGENLDHTLKDDPNGSGENLDHTSREIGIENPNEFTGTIAEEPIIEDTSNKTIETTTDNNSEEVTVEPPMDIVVDEVIETPKKKTKKS